MRTSAARRAASVSLVLALSACGPGAPAPVAPVAPTAPVRDGTPAAPVPAHDPGTANPAAAAAAAAPSRPWVDFTGTSIVGLGILRVVPKGEGPATFRIRYHEFPDGYSATGNLQLFVLPGDAFAKKDRAYASEFLAFARTADEAATGADGALRLEAEFGVERETTVLVGYGPWTAPDAGRPAGDRPTFGLHVSSADGAFEWIESEAGELITTNWTNRPGVARGDPCPDPVTDGRARVRTWIEVRPMILYDARLARADGEPPLPFEGPSPADLRAEADRLEREGKASLARDRRERAEDLDAAARRDDRRIVLTPELAKTFRRIPIRWR